MSVAYFGLQIDKTSETTTPEVKTKKEYVFTALPRNIALFVKAAELAVLHVIADYVFAYGKCLLSNVQIAEMLGMGRGKVNTAKKRLVEAGIIFEKSRGIKKSNIATLNETRLREIAEAGLLGSRHDPKQIKADLKSDHDRFGIKSCTIRDHDHDPKSISIKEEERINKEFNSSVSRETEKMKKTGVQNPGRDPENGTATKALSSPPKPPGNFPTEQTRDRSVSSNEKSNNVLSLKDARKRGELALATRIIACRYKDSNFYGKSIRRAAELILDGYSLDVLKTLELDDNFNGITGTLNYSYVDLVSNCNRIDDYLKERKAQ